MRRKSSEMVGRFGRPGDQDERDGEEENHHHHHHQASQSTRWDQSRERRGCRGTMLLSAAEKKVRVQTERHDNFCPPALRFAPYPI